MRYFRVVLIVGTVFFSSCSDSFLEINPQQSVSDAEALLNLQDFQSSITGIYNEISGSNYYGRYMFLIPDVMSDDVKQNVQANRIIFYAEHVVNVSDGDASNLWRDMYQAINAANVMINSDVAVPEAVIDERNHIIGEAYALRGLVYFDMVRFYAQHYTYTSDASHDGVPLVLAFDPLNEPARNTVDEVYNQVISDMTTAISMMDSEARSGNSNTLSSTSVKALLSRVYLYKEDWQNAEAMATEVIESGNYSMIENANYLNLWTTDNSSESIFEISMTETDNAGGSIAGLYLRDGFGDYLPSNDVISLYDPSDARLGVFVEDDNLSGDYAPYRMEKYPDINGWDNTKVIRLAELYLIRAEARAQIGTNVTGAQDDLDMVRQRGLLTAPDVSVTGQDLIDEIMLERRLELCFEGQRLWDLMRTKQDIIRTNCTAATCTIEYGSPTVIMPIPQDETDVNPNIRQNDGY